MKIHLGLVAGIAVAGVLAATEAQAAGFPEVVRAVLDSQTTGRLAGMAGDQRQEMTNCVIASLSGLPSGKKRYVVEGADLDEQEHRFGEVVQENRAEWKKKIAAACGRIALRKGDSD